jgi:hypothetical protein
MSSTSDGASLPGKEAVADVLGTPGDEPAAHFQEDSVATPFGDDARSSWARLLARIYEVLPLRCPDCGSDIRILAFSPTPTPSAPSSAASTSLTPRPDSPQPALRPRPHSIPGRTPARRRSRRSGGPAPRRRLLPDARLRPGRARAPPRARPRSDPRRLTAGPRPARARENGSLSPRLDPGPAHASRPPYPPLAISLDPPLTHRTESDRKGVWISYLSRTPCRTAHSPRRNPTTGAGLTAG